MKHIAGHCRFRRVVAPIVLLLCLSLGNGAAAAANGRPAKAVKTARAAKAARAKAALNKMGVASNFYLSRNPQQLSAIGAHWAYNWLPQRPTLASGLQWVPMVPTPASLTPQVLASLRKAKLSGEAQYLLGFNEPDMPSESNMTPEQAADLWPQLESTGLQLGSPAPARPGDGWLSQFMQIAQQRKLQVNFISLHYYEDFTSPGAVAWLRKQLIKIHAAYHKPIWITEIGAVDIRVGGRSMVRVPTAAEAATYLRQLFAMLNALPFVQRYASFTDSANNDPAWEIGSLFTGNGQLSPTGHAYQQIADTLERTAAKSRRRHKPRRHKSPRRP